MNIIQELEREQQMALAAKRAIPEFAAGDLVRVNVRVVEGTRERVQAYEGVCIARSGGGINESFTVRKISYGEGVERVFPVYAPIIESITVVRRGRVRRAKLYYLRGLRGKAARIPEKVDFKVKRTADGKVLKFKKPKGEADDFTLIDGIDAAMARKLNGLGLVQYAQLVNLSDDEIGNVDDALKLGGRYERENWAGKAQRLMAETTAHEVPAEDDAPAAGDEEKAAS